MVEKLFSAIRAPNACCSAARVRRTRGSFVFGISIGDIPAPVSSRRQIDPAVGLPETQQLYYIRKASYLQQSLSDSHKSAEGGKEIAEGGSPLERRYRIEVNEPCWKAYSLHLATWAC